MSNSQPNQLAGRWYLSAVGVALCLISALFMWLMSRSYLRAREMAQWPQQNCVMLSAEVEEVKIGPTVASEYQIAVLYRYEFAGKDYDSNRWGLRGSMKKSQREEVAELAKQYATGTVQRCWVNPQQPEFAVLKLDSRAAGYSLWFPGLFFIGGVGMVIGAWKKKANN